MTKISLKVVVGDKHLKHLSRVADEIAKKGFKVEETSEMAGAIFGQIEEDKVDSIKETDGVEQVRKETVYQHPPLDEKIPQ